MAIVRCPRCGAKNRVNEQAVAQGRQPVCGQCGAQLSAGAATQADTAGRPIVVTDETFAREVLQAGAVPGLVDCWAAWCGPCRVVAPILDELAAEARGRYRIAKLDVDKNKRIPAQFSIQGIPTLLIFKHGQLVDRLVGAHPKQTIAATLAAHS